MQGELMVSRREGFQKVYDLAERVLPDWVDTRMPDPREYATYLVDTTLTAHGFATQKTMTYLRKGQVLRDAIGEQLQARLQAGNLITIKLGDNNTVFVDPELLECRAPHTSATVKILSPFDNLVIQRERGRDIFNFDYQIECYVPQQKRQFGYFCLPLLYRDRLVGRIDCKASRKQRRLDLKSVHVERKVDEKFADRLQQAVESFAAFNGCREVSMPKVVDSRV